MAGTNINGIGFFSPAKWVVSKNAAEGNFTTIAAALTAASAGDTIVIMPGTYTENPTLVAGVNLCGFSSDSGLNISQDTSANVIISGECTMTTAGTVTISGIQLKTNSNYFLGVTGSAASIVNLVGCYLNASNNTGITYSSSSSSSEINISFCTGDVGTTSITMFVATSPGTLNISHSTFTNSGGTTTTSSINTTTMLMEYTKILFPLTVTAASPQIRHSWIDTSANPATGLTTVTSGTTTVTHTAIVSGSSSGVSVGSSTTVGLNITEVSSTNTDAITGSGTVNTNAVLYSNTSHLNNATTNGGGAMTGLTQGTNPTAGYIGESISSQNSSGVGMSISTITAIVNVALTPGVWDINAMGYIHNTAANMNYWQGGISTSSSTFSGNNGIDTFEFSGTANATDACLTISPVRKTISSNTTYYLVMTSNPASGTLTGYGRISATRVG
jgi:hypothetical protein